MIDWRSLVFHGLWILGLSILLAALSFNLWQAGFRAVPWREQLGYRSFKGWGWGSLALVSLGLAGTSSSLWETALWVFFFVVNLTFAIKHFFTREES